MEQELISVIVPIYNVEKYIDQCVESIVRQTYRNLEIILVDDGSPDRCPEICDQWEQRDSRIRVIHKENAGAGFARNTGIDCANGAFLCFFDSDDFVAEDALEKAYTLIRKENADIVVFGVTVVDQNGQTLRRVIPTGKKLVYRGAEVQSTFLPDLIDGNHNKTQNDNLCLSLWSCLFSADLIRKNEWRLVSEREYASEDSYSLILLYHSVGCVAILPEALYFYRETQGSLSRVYREDSYEKLREFYRTCQALAEHFDYNDEVSRRIAGLLLSQEIGALKQLVAADLPQSKKIAHIRRILNDEIMREALKKVNWQYTSRARNVLLLAMRRRMSRLVCLFVKLQILKVKN